LPNGRRFDQARKDPLRPTIDSLGFALSRCPNVTEFTVECGLRSRFPPPQSLLHTFFMNPTFLLLVASLGLTSPAWAAPTNRVEAIIANALGSPKNAPAIIGLAVIDNPKSLLAIVGAAVTALPEQTVEIVRVVLKFVPKRAVEVVRAAILAQPKLAPELVVMASLSYPELTEEFNKVAFEIAPDEMKLRGKTVSFAPAEEPIRARGAVSTSTSNAPSFPVQPIRPDLVSPSS